MNNDGAARVAQTTRLEELLAPWYSSIREATVSCVNSMRPDSRGCLWLQVKLVPRMAALEGFELLALLEYADWCLWKSQVRMILPLLTSDWENEEDTPRLTSVGIELLVSGDPESDVLLESAVVAARTHVLSPAFVEARAILLEAVVLQQHFQAIASRAAPRCYVGLRFRQLCLSLLPMLLDAARLQYLLDIVAVGVEVDGFGPIDPSVYRDHPQLYARAMMILFAQPCGAHAITFGYPVDTDEMVPGIWAAIRRSTTLLSVKVGLRDFQSNESRTLLLQWVVYALFYGGSDSYHRIQSLTLRVDRVKSADVDLARQVLHAENPLGLLLSHSIAETISASRFSLVPPWTTVFLPGWGHAWVHRDDILSTQRAIPGPLPLQSIANVTIQIKTCESLDAVMDLLCLVGQGIRELSIWVFFFSRERRSDDWCRRILQACPKLESLWLDGVNLDSVQVFTDGYTTTALTLTNGEGGLPELFQALGDRRHPAARFLCELVIHQTARSLSVTNPSIVPSLVRMLERNCQLHRLDVHLARLRAPITETEVRECISQVLAFDTQRIIRRLDFSQRLAFLSVFTPYSGASHRGDQTPYSGASHRGDQIAGHSGASHRGDQIARENFDLYILSLIFEFAAKTVKRRVALVFTRN